MPAPDPDLPPILLSFDQVTTAAGDGLREVSFEVRAGEAVALLGAQRGKESSPTIDLALGLRTPDSGQVRLFGGPPAAAVRAGRVGAMARGAGLMPGVDVTQLINLVRGLGPKPLALNEVVRQAGIGELTGLPVDQLGTPDRQRLRFALALVHAPALLLLDGLTAGLDDGRRAQLLTRLRELHRAGRAVVFTADNPAEVDGVADRVIVLQQGRVLADATVAELKAAVGVRLVTFTSPGAQSSTMRSLTGVTGADEFDNGSFRLETTDADATVAGLHAKGIPVTNLEVAPVGLGRAYRALLSRGPSAAPTTATPQRSEPVTAGAATKESR